MRTRRRGRWLPKQPRLGARMCQGTFFFLTIECSQSVHSIVSSYRKLRFYTIKKRSARIALWRSGIMSLARPAAGGESCGAGFYCCTVRLRPLPAGARGRCLGRSAPRCSSFWKAAHRWERIESASTFFRKAVLTKMQTERTRCSRSRSRPRACPAFCSRKFRCRSPYGAPQGRYRRSVKGLRGRAVRLFRDHRLQFCHNRPVK